MELHGIKKRFGGVTALDDVDFTVAPGSVHVLLGENGAGKTTLMRVAFGLLQPDAGEIRLFGQSAVDHSVRGALRAGVGMVHQHLSLVPTLSVTENVALGGAGVYTPGRATESLQRAEDSSGLIVPHDALVRDLSIVEQQRLEILKALAHGARLLILDEPTAVLAPAEIDDLLQWIRLFAHGGGSVVIVTHKLREALAVADEVTVLRRGRVVLVERGTQSSEEKLARAILPDAEPGVGVTFTAAPGEVVVQADAISVSGARGAQRVRNASFQLRRHEIIGIAAVEGSGHHELLLALSGLQPVTAGALRLPHGIGVIPADRARDAMIPEFTLVENVALHGIGHRKGLLSWRHVRERTAKLLSRFSIVATSPSAIARSLSGGNQQRLVVARELDEQVDVLIADNPTRGLDIHATAFVHDQLRQAAARGAAVVVHSSDLDEVLALATRVLVVYHGEVREVAPDHELVGRAMLGAA